MSSHNLQKHFLCIYLYYWPVSSCLCGSLLRLVRICSSSEKTLSTVLRSLFWAIYFNVLRFSNQSELPISSISITRLGHTQSSYTRSKSVCVEKYRWIYIVIVFADLAGLQLITFSDSLQHWSPRWIYWRLMVGVGWWRKRWGGAGEVIWEEQNRAALMRVGQWMSLMLPAFSCWWSYSPKGVKSHAVLHSSFLRFVFSYCLFCLCVAAELWPQRELSVSIQ